MSGEGVKTKEGPMEGISELLRCYICMQRLTNATLCPHCSKPSCFACIKHWVMDNHSNCPHCRNSLTLRDVIKIPLVDEVTEVLDTLHAVQKEVPITSSSEPEQEKCKKHHVKASVYCETCKICICHECALWEEEHRGHTFKPLNVIYQKHVEILQGELVKLQKRMKLVFSQVHRVEKKIESVKVNKSKTKKEIQHAVEKMCHQLDLTAKERIETLNKFRHELRNQAVEITKESHDLEKSITGGNVSALIEPNGDLKPELSAVIKRLLTSSHDMESLPVSNFTNQVVPTYDSATFRLTSFSELKRKGDEVYSDPLEVRGLVWRLKVYPNGHREEFGNYLAVFVELEKGYSTTANYQYYIEMPCQDDPPQRNRSSHIREYASDFADGESWGYRKFYELSHLEQDGFIKDDTLVLNFSVRPTTYYQKYLDQSNFLDKVTRERDALKQQLEKAKESITTLKNEYKTLLSDHNRVSSSSRTVPSQDGVAPPSLHSSQQHPAPHQRSSHHHSSQSAPQHRRDKGSRLERDNSQSRGRYVSRGAPISHHHSPSHPSLHTHNSPKRSSRYLSGHAGEGRLSQVQAEPRVGHMGDAHSSSQIYPGRKRSSEEAPGIWKETAEPRRKSAEPLLSQHSDKDPRSSKSQRDQPSSRDHRSRVNTVDKGSNEDLLSSQHWDRSASTSNIAIILNDEDKERAASASSSSTLIDSAEESPCEGGGGGGGRRLTTAQRNQQHLSQEAFEDDEDHKDMLSLSALEVGPTQLPLLSNYPHLYYESSSYFGEHQENYPPHGSKQDLAGLSQPSYPSPPKTRHGKSLTDLTGSNMSLTSSNQFLSQSIADFQHMQDQHHSPRHIGDSRRMHDHRFRPSYKKQPHMSSDSHLNYIPGLKNSVTSALSELKEEVEQKKARGKKPSSSHHIQRAASQQYHGHHSQHKAAGKLNQRHLRATVVEERREARSSPSNKRSASKSKSSPDKSESSPSSKHRQQEKQPSSTSRSATTAPEEDSMDEEEASPEVDRHIDAIHAMNSKTLDRSELRASRPLGSMKSNSTSSLNNLSQIL